MDAVTCETSIKWSHKRGMAKNANYFQYLISRKCPWPKSQRDFRMLNKQRSSCRHQTSCWSRMFWVDITESLKCLLFCINTVFNPTVLSIFLSFMQLSVRLLFPVNFICVQWGKLCTVNGQKKKSSICHALYSWRGSVVGFVLFVIFLVCLFCFFSIIWIRSIFCYKNNVKKKKVALKKGHGGFLFF